MLAADSSGLKLEPPLPDHHSAELSRVVRCQDELRRRLEDNVDGVDAAGDVAEHREQQGDEELRLYVHAGRKFSKTVATTNVELAESMRKGAVVGVLTLQQP